MTLLMARHGWQPAFENLGVGVAQIALDGTWAANRSLRDLLGYSSENLPANQFDAVFLAGDLPAEQQDRKRFLMAKSSTTPPSAVQSARTDSGCL